MIVMLTTKLELQQSSVFIFIVDIELKINNPI